MTVAEQIDQSRKNQGATKQWLADKLNITKQMYNYKDKNNSFSAKELVKLGKLLRIDLNSLK